MGFVKAVLVSIFWIALGVPFLEAADSECTGRPEGYTFPHEYDCAHYYQCRGGNKVLNNCPAGLYYSVNVQSCDIPALSGCTNTSPVANCTGINLGYYPYPPDCTKYVECYSGDSYLMDCPPGYDFDSLTEMCVFPSLANCVSVPTLSPPWTTPDPVCTGVRPGQTVLFPFPGNCNDYYECEGATLTLQTCGPFLFFDEDRQLCDFPALVTCNSVGTRTPDPNTSTPPSSVPPGNDPRCLAGGITYWPHPVDCHKYIECYGGYSYEMNCPPGLLFDTITSHCRSPSLAQCFGATSPSPPTTVTFPSDWTADPDCPYPESEDKLLVFPGNCAKFYECAEGKKMEFDCPPGLYFNPTISFCGCDYPYHTPCPAPASSQCFPPNDTDILPRNWW